MARTRGGLRRASNSPRQPRVLIKNNPKGPRRVTRSMTHTEEGNKNENSIIKRINYNENTSTSSSSSIDPIQNKNDEFDKLLNIKTLKNTRRTYGNTKKKANIHDKFVVNLSDEVNAKTLKWLLDSRNKFDRFTQSQRQSIEPNSQNIIDIDMPSVSQRKSQNNNEIHSLRKRSSSLDLNRKPDNKLRFKRHSVSGETPNNEYFNIEEFTPPNNHVVENLLAEDEFLNLVDDECLNKKNTTISNVSGWKRMEDMKKVVKKTSRTPKKLNIIAKSTQKSPIKNPSDLEHLDEIIVLDDDDDDEEENVKCNEIEKESKEDQLSQINRIVNMEKFENFARNAPITPVLDNISNSTQNNDIREIVKPKKDYLLWKRKEKEIINNIKAVKFLTEEIDVILSNFKTCFQLNEEFDDSDSLVNINTVEKYFKQLDPRTSKLKYFVDSLNRKCLVTSEEYKQEDVETQTSEDFLSKNVQKNDVETQTKVLLKDTSIQTTQNQCCDKKSQTNIERKINCNVKTQTEIRNCHKIIQTDDNIKKIFDNKNVQTSPLNIKSQTSEKSLKTDLQYSDLIISIESPKSHTVVKPIVQNNKRLRSTDSEEREESNKRPCSKFILDDLSVVFESEGFEVATKKVINNRENEEISQDIYEDLINASKQLVEFQRNEKSSSESSDDLDFISHKKNKNNGVLGISEIINIPNTFLNNKTTARCLFKEATISEIENIEAIMTPNILNELQQSFQCNSPSLTNQISNLNDENKENEESEMIINSTPIESLDSRNALFSLDVTLPPPLEFQDDDEKNENTQTKIFKVPTQEPSKKIQKMNQSNQSEHSDNVASGSSSMKNKKSTSSQLNKTKIKFSNPSSQISKRELRFSPLPVVSYQSSQLISQNSSQKSKESSILEIVSDNSQTDIEICESLQPLSKKPLIVCSRLGKEQMISVSALANKKLISYTSTYSNKVTHLIVLTEDDGRIKYHTVKYAFAVAHGIWVLGFNWVKDCLEKKCLLPEEPYEVLDISGVDGPRQSRLSKDRKLLKDFKIHIVDELVSATKKDIMEIIELCGGKVVKNFEDLEKTKNGIRLIITEIKATQDFSIFENWLMELGVISVDVEWLVRSVGQNKLLSLKTYTLCPDEFLVNLEYPAHLLVDDPYTLSH